MNYNAQDPKTWPTCRPHLIAHDVGRTIDRSTAVVGGICPFGTELLGILEAEELPQGLFGSMRANALGAVDRRYDCNGLIIADLSNDATYAEFLFERFGPRLIGLQISRHGNGTNFERWPFKGGSMLVYVIGRNNLIETLFIQLQSDLVKFVDGAGTRLAYQQLVNLQTEFRDSGKVYKCPSGQHDDLGISCAMLAWAARHPHLEYWMRNLYEARRPRKRRQALTGAAGWT